MVTTLAAHEPLTPAGKPVTVAPVAPVVLYVIVVIGAFTQTVCALVPAAELSVMVLSGIILTVGLLVNTILHGATGASICHVLFRLVELIALAE